MVSIDVSLAFMAPAIKEKKNVLISSKYEYIKKTL